MDIGINEYDTFESCQDIIQLGSIRLQELTTRRHIEEQVINLEITSHRTGNRLLSSDLRPSNRDLGSYLIFLSTCLQFNLCHGSNRSQSLATESHGVQGKQIVGLRDLRCSMALERESCISLAHTLTIVDNLNRGTTSIHHNHMDGLGTCINRILNQLLDNRSRTLYYLTSSNLVSNTIGK